ncbi:Thiolase-like protein [Venustampulla echinocandica]|uniref:Thiolase-like protein n=1 Tax=Venustampulla echinocandica TaxID=2656787 RepID=A0A370TA24_9HELO|nr:Thiolase-like protein [Venustampulla echinocandica]RDL30666.1 Thiolase-like protein [Venustampulla echinocandica]
MPESSRKMAFLLFGDQSLDTFGFLYNLCHYGTPSLLSRAFLQQVSIALCHELDCLPSIERKKLPIFTNIEELNERYHDRGTKHSGIESALLCITQLAYYLDRAEKVPEDATTSAETCLVGLCTGLFAAAAVACSPSLSALVRIAVQVTVMAFRTGSYVATLGDNLSGTSDNAEPWTYVVPGASEALATTTLRNFHETKGIPLAGRAYISAITSTSVAISGPPSTLTTLWASDVFAAAPLPIHVYSPYHASHLHPELDSEKILGLDDPEVLDALDASKPVIPILSSATGQWYDAETTSGLMKGVFQDILTQPLQFHRVLDGCLLKAQTFRGSRCLVIPIGPTHAGSSLVNTLKAKTDLEVVLRRTPFGKNEPSIPSGKNSGASNRGKLAIVGMAGRFPDAASHEKLWELLQNGLDVHREVPKDRFDVATHVDLTGKTRNTSHTPYGCWIENPGLFDPRFFNMSPREAFQTDPMQRLALATAYEALEMSGYVPNRTASTKLDRIGTFYGQTSDDWREINAAQDVDTYFITGGVRAFGPGRINYHFGFSGPSFNIDTACSSSAAALQLACTSLWAGDCDTAIVGGLSCMTNSDIFAGLSRGQFLSKNGPCATFDNDADGYCRADGVGTVIVKKLEDAQADKDNILGVILATATNHSAEAVSITHPHGGTQEILYRSIMNKAGVDPLDVDYVEMHGTGTQAGDGTEMRSVTNVFAPADRRRSADQPLFLGAVKANVGHGEAASGVTALIKVLLMLQKNAIPPHVGIKNVINKTFPTDLAERNVNIAFHTTPLRGKPGLPRRIFVNNFSAAGGNTGLLLEDGPAYKPAVTDPRSMHVVSVTAKSKAAMFRNASRLMSYLEEHPNTSISDLAYTTTARRIQHNWRMLITASDIQQAQATLKCRMNDTFIPVLPEPPKVAFTFTGQGSHYAALGKDLYENSSNFRESIEEFDRITRIHGFPSFIPLIDGSVADVASISPVVVQVGLVCFEIAMARLWESWGIAPSVLIGHSLGEYSALCVSGVLSVSDTIYLVGSRAQLLVEECTADTHAMLAVQGTVSSITDALQDTNIVLSIACINGPRETVLSGKATEMADLADSLTKAGFKCTRLQVPFAFHSAQVDPILDEFERIATAIRFQKAKVPLISPLLGRPVTDAHSIGPNYLRNHAREAVNFLGGLVSAQDGGLIDDKTIWLEVGPHPVCSGIVKATFGATTITTPSLRRKEDAYRTICGSLSSLQTAGVNIDWNEYHRDFAHAVRLLDLPSYSFDDKNYWIQYEGDWCLTKGAGALPAPEPAKAAFSTTTIHNIVKENVTGKVVTIVTETELTRPDLRPLVTGHVVNGAYLCPSSLYGDMAMTVCDYGYKLADPDVKDLVTNVAHMAVPKSLILKPNATSHILTLSATIDTSLRRANLIFSSGSDKEKVEHANCTVFFGAREEYLSEWNRQAYLIQSRVDWLKDAEAKGQAHKIGRGLAYKLFAALVDYDQKYRGMEEVILHSANMEATSRVVFQTTAADGSFFCSPYWIDSVAHISGFIVNGSDAVDSRENVYISHGWESLRVAEPFSAEKQYRSYVRMQPTENKVMSGDVYVFDGDTIIAMVGGLKFQCIPRRVMNMLMPPVGAAASSAKPASGVPHQTKPAAGKSTKTAQVTMKTISKVNAKLASVCSQALDILATEVGVGNDELADNIAFTDLGVDSLMSLTVSGRLREDLDIDVPSSAFLENPTIGSFKAFLSKFEQKGMVATTNSDSPESHDQTTPDLELEDPDTGVTTPLDDTPSEDGNTALGGIIRTTIAGEMGVEIDEIIDAHDLSTMGMDSLMSLSILGSLREKTGLALPSDLLASNPSIKAIERSLNIGATSKRPKAAKSIPAPAAPPAPLQARLCAHSPERLATSVLLQGNTKRATKHLWMVPDGSGSATSYTEIADVGSHVAVWGLNSPYMKTPEEFKCGVYGMAEHFIKEIKRRQPQGPYLLAGWSAGGVIAFEAVRQLLDSGDEIEQLIIIDAPCPEVIEPLPASLHRWFAEVGILGDGDMSKLPKWLLPHFAASVTALSNYTAVPIDPVRAPFVTAIWCEDGVCKLPTDPRPDPYPDGHALFLLDNRNDFGPNLWDRYLNGDRLVTHHMPGNHFTMMKGGMAKILGKIIRDAISRTSA